MLKLKGLNDNPFLKIKIKHEKQIIKKILYIYLFLKLEFNSGWNFKVNPN